MRKKLIIVLVTLVILISGSFYLIYNLTNQVSEETEEVDQSENNTSTTVQETSVPVVSDEDLIPYSDLPDYVYSSQEISLSNENQKIFGQCLIPEDAGEKVPLVICCHGLSADFISMLDYGRVFAQKGLAVYTFDFRGGGGKQSEGKSTDMSVMTEVSDLEVVLENARTWDFVDPNKIVLFGESQGGLVSAIVSARHPEEIAGVILEYPAFSIGDTIHEIVEEPDQLPDSYSFGGIAIGQRYVYDMWDYDTYSEIANYPKRVLIIQGSEDKVVLPEYAERAAQTYPDAEYYLISGAGHGFTAEAFEESLGYIFNYLERIGIINVKTE